MDTTLVMGTEVAAFLIYHPDDLAHAEGWPIAWYSEPFIYPVESGAGRLVGWITGSDGYFSLRFTTGYLTERERPYARAEWTFPLKVRRGRIFVDNSDGLPGEERMDNPAKQPEQWIDLPNGDYAVTVTAIEWDAEPGAKTGSNNLPNYVIGFHAGTDLSAIPPARCPPTIDAWRGPANDDVPPPAAAFPSAEVDVDKSYLGFETDKALAHGRPLTLQSEINFEGAVSPGEDNEFAMFDLPLVAAPRLEVGQPALCMRLTSATGQSRKRTSYGLASEGLVRIVAVDGPAFKQDQKKGGWFSKPSQAESIAGLSRVRIEPWRVDHRPSAVPLSDFRQALSALLDRNAGTFGKRIEYERLRLNGFSTHDGMAGWAVRELPLPPNKALEISAMTESDRVAWLLAYAAGQK